MGKIRVLFLPPVDADNINAQSLNTREIVLRLDPGRFESTVWYEREPDIRLRNRPSIRLKQLPRRIKTLRILKEQLSGYEIVAYMDYSPASYLLLMIPRLLRGRTKTVFHAEAPRAQTVNPSRLLRIFVRAVTTHCDAYTAITDYVARDMACVGTRARYILPVGVDSKFFLPPPGRSVSVPTVLFVGTLIERKGPQYVLDAAVHFPAAKFRLIGPGRDGYEHLLHRKILETGLRNVVLDGPRSQAEVADAMRQSDIFLFPSRLEGFGKVTLEAAATGLPAIVFQDYDTPVVRDGVTGFQVHTLEEMLDRLGKLIADSDMRKEMGLAARRHAEQFDWEIVSRHWEDAYWQIAAGH